MRNKIESLPKTIVEDVLVKTLDGGKKVNEKPSQENVLQFLEMPKQQSNY